MAFAFTLLSIVLYILIKIALTIAMFFPSLRENRKSILIKLTITFGFFPLLFLYSLCIFSTTEVTIMSKTVTFYVIFLFALIMDREIFLSEKPENDSVLNKIREIIYYPIPFPVLDGLWFLTYNFAPQKNKLYHATLKPLKTSQDSFFLTCGIILLVLVPPIGILLIIDHLARSNRTNYYSPELYKSAYENRRFVEPPRESRLLLWVTATIIVGATYGTIYYFTKDM